MASKLNLAIVLFAALTILPGEPGNAAFEAANGKLLAQKWCSSCHLVTSDQIKASADAPPFATISRKSDEELNRLQTFLLDPHPVMPNFSLSRDQITDLIAYIRSLKE
ncbi:MAG: cytochrome c [Hyphomicrobiaceae bacterium]|nr:cytochrome c [Hyphomicrobiaceae bacterium]